MWLTLQALSGFSPRPAGPSFNPNPPGQIKDDSTTYRVLRFLRDNPQRFMAHAQIVEGTGCRSKSVAWAVFYLRDLKVVESRHCGGRRSSLYMEYRAMAPIDCDGKCSA